MKKKIIALIVPMMMLVACNQNVGAGGVLPANGKTIEIANAVDVLNEMVEETNTFDSLGVSIKDAKFLTETRLSNGSNNYTMNVGLTNFNLDAAVKGLVTATKTSELKASFEVSGDFAIKDESANIDESYKKMALSAYFTDTKLYVDASNESFRKFLAASTTGIGDVTAIPTKFYLQAEETTAGFPIINSEIVASIQLALEEFKNLFSGSPSDLETPMMGFEDFIKAYSYSGGKYGISLEMTRSGMLKYMEKTIDDALKEAPITDAEKKEYKNQAMEIMKAALDEIEFDILSFAVLFSKNGIESVGFEMKLNIGKMMSTGADLLVDISCVAKFTYGSKVVVKEPSQKEDYLNISESKIN